MALKSAEWQVKACFTPPCAICGAQTMRRKAHWTAIMAKENVRIVRIPGCRQKGFGSFWTYEVFNLPSVRLVDPFYDHIFFEISMIYSFEISMIYSNPKKNAGARFQDGILMWFPHDFQVFSMPWPHSWMKPPEIWCLNLKCHQKFAGKPWKTYGNFETTMQTCPFNVVLCLSWILSLEISQLGNMKIFQVRVNNKK